MKRKSRTNKRVGKKFGKRSSKKVYKKKMTKKSRRSSRKMRGGADPFHVGQPIIEQNPEDVHDLDTSLSLDATNDEEGHTDSEAETQTTNSFSNVASNLQGNTSNISAISNDNSAGTMSVGELNLSNASSMSGATDMSTSFGGKRRKGKKTQKRRRGKKGGELPSDYNPNDRDPDPSHD